MASKKQPKKSGKSGGGPNLPKWLGWVPIILAIAAGGYYMIPDEPPAPANMVDTRPEALAAGAGLFAQHCATCHGESATGQDPNNRMGGTTAAGAFLAPALNGSAHAWHHPPDALFSVVKHGSPAEGSPMVGFGGKLSDAEIGAVLGYLHGLWPAQIREQYDIRFPRR